KIMLVCTHKMYGEAAGWKWPTMTSQDWGAFRPQFIGVLQQVVQHYGNRVAAYEIWNEGDAEAGNPAAVHFPAKDFAPLLDSATQVIRQHAPQSAVIMGGLVRGAAVGAKYITDV